MDAIIIDIKTAFLHRDLDKEMYMNLLDGMEGSNEDCLLLLKALYGLVQGACQWWKKFVGILKTINFKGGYVGPCLMIKHSNDRTIFASIYADDNVCIRHTKALAMFVEDLKKQGLTIKVSSKLTNYLSCLIKISEDRKSAWIGQPHLIEKLCTKFGHLVQNMQSYHTPGTQIVRVQEFLRKTRSYTTLQLGLFLPTQVFVTMLGYWMELIKLHSRSSQELSSLYWILWIMASRSS